MNRIADFLSRLPAFLLLFLLLPGAGLVAEELPPGMIMIEGMRFYCPSCRKASSTVCELVFDGDATELPCARLLGVLLTEELRQPQVSYPTAAELERFLVEGRPTPVEAENSLRLLARTNNGAEYLERSAPVLLARYPDIVGDLLKQGWGTDLIWQQVLEGEELIGDRPAAPDEVAEAEENEESPLLPDAEVPVAERGEGGKWPTRALVLLLVVAAVSGVIRLRRRLTSSPASSEPRRPEREELRMLRRYFGLSLTEGVAELNRTYRERARKLHPDTGSGNAEAFMQLTERYQRAKELLSATEANVSEDRNSVLMRRQRGGER